MERPRNNPVSIPPCARVPTSVNISPAAREFALLAYQMGVVIYVLTTKAEHEVDEDDADHHDELLRGQRSREDIR